MCSVVFAVGPELERRILERGGDLAPMQEAAE